MITSIRLTTRESRRRAVCLRQPRNSKASAAPASPKGQNATTEQRRTCCYPDREARRRRTGAGPSRCSGVRRSLRRQSGGVVGTEHGQTAGTTHNRRKNRLRRLAGPRPAYRCRSSACRRWRLALILAQQFTRRAACAPLSPSDRTAAQRKHHAAGETSQHCSRLPGWGRPGLPNYLEIHRPI